MMDSGLAFDDFSPDFLDSVSNNNNNDNSHKRKRSTTPTNVPVNKAADPATLAANLTDPIERNAALNELLRVTSTNYALDSELILKGLASLVFECLDWTPPRKDRKEKPVFLADKAWTEHASTEAAAWASHCQDRFSHRGYLLEQDKIRVLEAVLVILRNLSFSAANARLLAFSPDILAVLIGCLYEFSFFSFPANLDDASSSSASSSTIGDLSLPALHALQNLAPHIDPEGQKLFVDKLFLKVLGDQEGPVLPDPSSFGQATDNVWGFGSLWLAKRLDTKEDVLTDVPASMLLELTNASDYLVGVWSIFPAMANIMTDSKTPRTVLIQALDLFQEFVNQARVGVVGSVEDDSQDKTSIPTARAILVHMPDTVLERLIDFLYVPRLGPDSLAYEDPTTTIVTRVTTLKLMMGYDATVDTDVRDRALDILVPLLEIDSPRMAERLATNKSGRVRTRLFDALVPILAGQVGRNESSMLASQLLKELAKADGASQLGLSYIKHRLIEKASRDARVGQLVFEHLYESDESDGEGSEDPEETI